MKTDHEKEKIDESRKELMSIGIASDHGGFELKTQLALALKVEGYRITDFGSYELVPGDDYPDYVIPLAIAVSEGKISRGIAICGSGVGACIAANKIRGVRAALITDSFSAHQGVEDDNMNVMCLGGRVTGTSLAWELVQAYLNADFKTEEQYARRLAKIAAIEK